jgi:Flp pilus assembly protein TadD
MAMALVRLRAIVLCACCAASAAWAAGGGGEDAAPASADMQKAVAAIQAARYPEAITLLRTHVARSPNDADAFNWLGFAYRKSGQLDQAFATYKRALSIDPKHRGAHEYLGEAWLQAGQPEKADEELRTLATLCPGGCEQRADLQQAITDYRAKKVSAR